MFWKLLLKERQQAPPLHPSLVHSKAVYLVLSFISFYINLLINKINIFSDNRLFPITKEVSQFQGQMVTGVFLWITRNEAWKQKKYDTGLQSDTNCCINGESVRRANAFEVPRAPFYLEVSPCQQTPLQSLRGQGGEKWLPWDEVLRRHSAEREPLMPFSWAMIEGLLTYCTSCWYISCSAADKKALQRVVKTEEKITCCPLPSLENIATSRYISRATNIIKHFPPPPGHCLFELLPSLKDYRLVETFASRFRYSFSPQ